MGCGLWLIPHGLVQWPIAIGPHTIVYWPMAYAHMAYAPLVLWLMVLACSPWGCRPTWCMAVDCGIWQYYLACGSGISAMCMAYISSAGGLWPLACVCDMWQNANELWHWHGPMHHDPSPIHPMPIPPPHAPAPCPTPKKWSGRNGGAKMTMSLYPKHSILALF